MIKLFSLFSGAGYYKMDGRNNQYIADNKVKKIIGMYDKNNKKLY